LITTPNIRFSSTIRVVNDDEFSRFNAYALEQQDMVADYPWTHHERVRLKPQGLTTEAFNCNAGGITNGDRLTLFHLEPTALYDDERKLDETTDALESDILELKKENPNLRAVLTGGDADDESSLTLKESLLALFAKFRIPVSILWGANGTDVHYDTTTDTWTLHAHDMPATLDDFRERFPDAHIAAGDQLIIDEEEIDPTDLTQ